MQLKNYYWILTLGILAAGMISTAGRTWNRSLPADVRPDLRSENYHPRIDLNSIACLNFLHHKRTPITAPPMLSSPKPTGCYTIPKNGANNVFVNSRLTADFSGPITKTSFFVVGPDNKPIKGSITNDERNQTVSFVPDATFAPDTTYTATIDNTADRVGGAIGRGCTWSFTTEPLVLIELADINFAHDSSSLSPQGKAILDENIRIMKGNPKLRVLVAGYTSASGSNEYNQKLSERRATAVRNYLIHSGGISPDRLKKIGYGETQFAHYENDPEDIESRVARDNRSVLFIIIVK